MHVSVQLYFDSSVISYQPPIDYFRYHTEKVTRDLPDLEGWLKKISFVAADYLTLLRVFVLSCRPPPVGQVVRIHPVSVPPVLKPNPFHVARENLIAILATIDYTGTTFPTCSFEDIVRKFEVKMRKSTSPRISTSAAPHWSL